MNRKVPSKAQRKGEVAGEWSTLWGVAFITFIVGVCFGAYKAVKDNVALPSWLALDDDDDE